MRYKGILFDLDGTVLDTSGLIVESFQAAIERSCGRRIAAQEVYPFFGRPLPEAMRHLAPTVETEVLIDAYRAHHMRCHDARMATFPHVADTLRELDARGVKMGIVTSRRRETGIRGLSIVGLEAYFPVVIGVYQTERHKPDPQPVQAALKQLALSPAETLMVGDSPADLAAGHRAGLVGAAVRWTHMDWAALERERPEYILETMADLLPIVSGEAHA